MNRSVFIIIVVILLVVLAIIFGAWFLIDRGLLSWSGWRITPTTSLNESPTVSTTTALFPPGEAQEPPAVISADEKTPTTEVTAKLAGNDIFHQLTSGPIGGALVLGAASTSPVIFAERATGHLYQISENRDFLRLTNTTIPKVYQLFGGATATTTNFVFTTLGNDQLTWLRGELADNPTDPVFKQILSAPWGIGGGQLTALAVSPTTIEIATAEINGPNTTIYQSDWRGKNRRSLFSLSLTELDLAWPGADTITLQSKPSASALGVFWTYHLKTRQLTPIINRVFGLSAKLSPNGHFIVYSGNSGNGFFTALYDQRTQKISRLPFKTLADKCVWGKLSNQLFCAVPEQPASATYPDSWYQGLIAFDDIFWQYDPEKQSGKLLYSPILDNLGQKVDAIDLLTDPSEKYLYLTNKNDLTLWVLNLRPGF